MSYSLFSNLSIGWEEDADADPWGHMSVRGLKVKKFVLLGFKPSTYGSIRSGLATKIHRHR
jgi:hypothetical protein